jgi:NADH-quinone oxidoreductase subunit M
MVFICLSSLGLPGLNGFIGEVLALIGMFKARPWYAVIAAAGIILGAWYLLLMLQRAFFGPLRLPAHTEEPLTDLNRREIASLVPIAVLCVAIGVYPKPFLDAMRPDVHAVAAIYEDPDKLEPPPGAETLQAETRTWNR